MLANRLESGDTIGLIAPNKALKNKDKKYVENATKYIDKLFNANQIINPYDKRDFFGFKDEEIKGKIYGTNVRCLLKVLGTPYMPDLKDSILFLEGFHSNIIQWNTMLEQYNQMKVI